VVAQNIFALDAKFWMRIAMRSDSASDAADKSKLKELADTVMVLVDALVKQSEQKLTDSAGVLQEILTAAADDNGEWYIPLTEQQVRGREEGGGVVCTPSHSSSSSSSSSSSR
jgi:hypothetical protein